MIFSLEALQAGTGDSLILHFGDEKSPRFIVIDGGPKDIYDASLKPRLEQLASKFGKGDDRKLNLAMVMLSHIDDDHIHGIVDWMTDLSEGDASEQVPINIERFWYNSFKDVLGRLPKELLPRTASMPEAVGAWVASTGLTDVRSQAVLASFKQGNQLFGLVKQLGFPLNEELGGFISTDNGKTKVKVGPLTLTVLSPNNERLKALYAEWRDYITTHRKEDAEVASYVDRSIYNLSSIVVLAELADKGKTRRILLTGDSRGDDIVEGLKAAGLLKKTPFHVDILKMPHHGSSRNVAPEFFESIVADHYVISANGEHDNPDIDTLKMLSKARGAEKYTIYLTNKKCVNGVGAKVQKFFKTDKAPGRSVVFREEDALSITVNLLTKLKY